MSAATSITTAKTNSKVIQKVYDVGGVEKKTKRGLQIIEHKDGTVKKVIMD